MNLSNFNSPRFSLRWIEILIDIGLTGVLVACGAAPSAAPPTSPQLAAVTSTPITHLTPFFNSTGTPKPDRVIPPEQTSGAIKVLVGQTIRVTRPDDFDEWQVDYNSAALTILTPPEKIKAPGLEGWLFRAIKSGETEIVIISVLPQCQKDSPCPNLNPERFAIKLQVQ